MEQLKSMKEQITSLVQGQLANVQNVDAKELGEAIDMIKDLAEATYYCTITEAMEGKDKQQQEQPRNNYYYTERYYPIETDSRMYYGGGQGNDSMGRGGNSTSRYYSDYRMSPDQAHGMEYEYPMRMDMHDPREGRSPMTRKMYMESKEMHQSKEYRMKELEKYLKELSHDITEMIEDATPEEKQLLKQKVETLAEKIV